MRIENTADEVIIALPKNIITQDEIQRLLNYFRYKELVAKSQATETQIAELTSEIKKGVAERSAKSRKNNLALPNHTLTDDELLDVIFESKEQIKNGNSYTMEEMKQRIESWKKK